MRRFLGALAVVLGLTILAPQAGQASFTDIVLVSSATNSVNAATTLTVNGVVVNGNGRELLIGISLAANVTVNSVFYNPGSGNVAVPLLVSLNSPNNTERGLIYGLANPAISAAGTVTVNLSGASDIVMGAVCYANVGSVATASSNGNTNAPSLATGAGSRQAIFANLAQDNSATTAAPTANFNTIWDITTTGGSGGGTENAIGGDQPGALSGTVSWTLTATRQWSITAVVMTATAGFPTVARYRHAAAVAGADRVRVTWSTSFEQDNIGFRVFKEDASGRHQVSRDVIAGSALFITGRKLPRGRTYAFDDMGPPDTSASYYIEDVDTHGKKTAYGPIGVQAGPLATAGGAPLTPPPLSSLSRTSKRKTRGHAALAAKRGRGPLAVQQDIAGHAALKISVSAPGWYRVTGAELAAAGLPADANPKKLALTNGGQPVAFTVRGGAGKALAPTDAIEFFGTGQDTSWTDSEVYWLTWHDGSGARVNTVRAAGNGRSTATGYPFRVVRHDRSFYAATVHNGEADNFFGPLLLGDPVTQALDTPHPDFGAGGTATLTVSLMGFSDQHAVTVTLNGNLAGVVSWSGLALGQASFPVPVSWLVVGTNTVALNGATGDDISGVDFVQLDYQHAYTADTGELYCTAQGGAPQVIRGFSNNAVRLVDVTDPGNARELDATIQADGSAFALAFTPPGSGTRTLIAFTDDSAATVGGVTANRPSAWNAAGNAGRLVILTHRDFAAAMEPLRARRAGQLGSAAIVDVEDVYDEFNFGAKSPYAIRDFVRAAAGWRTPPRYVLLVGDATFNPRLYAQEWFDGAMDFDFLPTKIVDTDALEVASDDWFTDADGDGVADVPIGRLPVRTADEAAAAVSKILAYEDGAADPAWTRSAALVSDATDGATDFFGHAALAGAALPAGWTTQRIACGVEGYGAARQDLLTALNGNSGLVVFYGHASQDQWCEPGIMFTSDAAGLAAGYRAPVMLSMCCLAGLFDDIFVECIAKDFVKAPGGPVAVWASTGFCNPEPQAALGQGFVHSAAGLGQTLGEAAIAAKRSITDHDARVTWTLFGDPSQHLR